MSQNELLTLAENFKEKRIAVFCRDTANLTELTNQLSSQGATVAATTSLRTFFSEVSDNSPDLIMISENLDPVLASQIPGYFKRKFNIPLFLFKENESLADSGLSLALPPGEKIAVCSNSENLIQELTLFVKSTSVSCSEIMHALAKKVQAHTLKVPSHTEVKVYTLKVKDPESQGHFVFGFPTAKNQDNFRSSLREIREFIKTSFGKTVDIELCSFSLPYYFYDVLKTASTYAIEGRWQEQEVLIIYFENPPTVDLSPQDIASSGHLVPIEEWWSEVPLSFRAYIKLNYTGHKVQYCKKGRKLDKTVIERFEKKGISQLQIDESDVDSYLQLKEMALLAGKKKNPQAA